MFPRTSDIWWSAAVCRDSADGHRAAVPAERAPSCGVPHHAEVRRDGGGGAALMPGADGLDRTLA